MFDMLHKVQNVYVLYRLTTEVDSEELSWVQSSVDEVITMLHQSPVLPSIPEVRCGFNTYSTVYMLVDTC